MASKLCTLICQFFCFKVFLSLVLNSFSCFDNFSVVLSMVTARVIYMTLGVIYVTLNKKGIFLRVFDL